MILRSSIATNPHLLVIGGETAKGLATHLAEEWQVTLLTDDEKLVQHTAPSSFEVYVVDFEATDLKRYAADADAAIVVTEHDQVGFLVAQLLTTTCGVDSVLARVDDPKNTAAFEAIDCEILETGPLFQPEIERKLAPADG